MRKLRLMKIEVFFFQGNTIKTQSHVNWYSHHFFMRILLGYKKIIVTIYLRAIKYLSVRPSFLPSFLPSLLPPLFPSKANSSIETL